MAQTFNSLAGTVLVAFSTVAAAQTPPPPVDEPTEQAEPPQPQAPTDQPATPPSTQTEPAPANQPSQTAPADQASPVTEATAADIKAGVSVYDQKGDLVGTIESVSSTGAIVSTGKARAEIPLSSFGKNDKGLVVSVTKAELDAAAEKEAAEEDAEPTT